MPQGPVVVDALGIGFDSIRVEELGLMALAEVPVETQGGNGEIGPAVSNGEIAEIDVPGPMSFVRYQCVWCTRIAMDQDRMVHVWSLPQRFRVLPQPNLRGPLSREFIDRYLMDRSKSGGDGRDRLGSA